MENKQSLPKVGKVSIFKLQLDKIFFKQITSDQSVISPRQNNYSRPRKTNPDEDRTP